MTFPVHHYYRLVVLIIDEKPVGLFPASHLVPREKLGGPDNTVEDQAEPSAFEGSSPMELVGPVE